MENTIKTASTSISIIQQIEFMIKENQSSTSINEILTNLFNKYNITYDIIETFINDTNKCKECVYLTDYNNTKVFLKCNQCNNINNCKMCFNTITNNNNNKYRRNNINKIMECNNCSEKMAIDTCNICHCISCICNIQFGC
jgi:hypothetical protein